MLKKNLIIFLMLPSLFLSYCNKAVKPDAEQDKIKIKAAIENSIGWAFNKDKDLLYSVVAQDSDFFIYHPDNNTIAGFENFKNLVETVFMDDGFKALRFEVKDLKITLSSLDKTAWFSCLLDDFGEFNGQPGGWENVRWTGVLEKREGNWTIVQMHFSYSTEQINDEKNN